jgi:hypothetical protein
MAAECELIITGGSTCSVAAVGRCASCHRAFCESHASYVSSDSFIGGPRTEYSRTSCIECPIKAASQAAASRLTPERFVELANAAGKPGLRTWTVGVKGLVPVEVKTRFSRKTEMRPGLIDKYDIHGWMIPATKDLNWDNISWLQCLMVTDQASINALSLGRKLPKSDEDIFTERPKDHAWQRVYPIDSKEITFDYWNIYGERGMRDKVAMDSAVRELCRLLGISIPPNQVNL